MAEGSGLSVALIRTWERRYGTPTPHRLPSGHRRYHQVDLERLRLMAEALAHGQRPSKVARADADSLNCMLLPQGGARLDPLWEAVKAMEPERIRTYLQVHLTGLGWQCFLEEILAPLLDRFDISWAKGEVGVYHEHLLTEELEDLRRRMQQVLSVREGRARVLLCTLPGERHRLGMLMGALRHAGKGIHTRLMGV
ncbi:MAG: MerR family transcriptional regulator, partial [Acidobacteria bacterium]|nr:MerR family transcriptional regulator [Acidobacteriota bacterium]